MKLTPEAHTAFIKQALEQGHSHRWIARKLFCDHSTVSKFVTQHLPDVRSTVRLGVPPLPTEEPSEIEKLRQQHSELKAAARKHRSVDVQAEMLLDEVRSQVTPAPLTYEPPDVAEGDGHSHMQVLLLSDLHVGEVVKPEAVNGMNEYNWDIFTQRMASIQKSLFSFQNARPYPIDELVIALLGDNVSNSHHKELEVTNEFPITEQCYRGGMFLGKWIEALVPHYPRIRVVGVGGNHGRVDQRPASKNVFDSFDWLGFQYMRQHLANYDLEIHTPRAGMLVTEVAGRNMLVWHGDGVRSSMPGVPWGGVTRRVNELKKQYAEQGVLIDYVALGHFHQLNIVQGNTFMNGSLIGLTEYGLKNFGSGERPAQLLLTFDRDKRRLTDASFITP